MQACSTNATPKEINPFGMIEFKNWIGIDVKKSDST